MGLWGDPARPLTPPDSIYHYGDWVNQVLEGLDHKVVDDLWDFELVVDLPEPDEDYGQVEAENDVLGHLYDLICDDLEAAWTKEQEHRHFPDSEMSEAVYEYIGELAMNVIRWGYAAKLTKDDWRAVARRERWGRRCYVR